MTKRRKPRGSILDRSGVVRQVGSEYGLSWWVLVLFTIPSFLAQIIFDPHRLGGSVADWLQIAFGAQLVAAFIFGLGRLVLLSNRRLLNFASVIVLYAVVGFFRGLFLFVTSQSFGFIDPESDDFSFRLSTGPVFTVSLMSVCALMISNIQRNRALETELALERGRLRLASVNLQSQVERLRTELVSRVSAMLDPAIQNLQDRITNAHDPETTSLAVVDLKNTVEDVVRPLSHDISKSNFDTLILQTEEQIRGRAVPKLRTVKVHLLPFWASLLLFSVSIGTASVTRGVAPGFLLSGVSAVALWVWLSAIQTVVNRRKFRFAVAGLIFFFSFYVSTFVVDWVTQILGSPLDSTELLGAQILLPLMGVVFFIATVNNDYRLSNIDKLRDANNQFQLLNSRLRRQVWLDHRKVANVLHGQVQGALYAAAIRLNQTSQPTRGMVNEVQADIADALKALNQTEDRFEDFSQVYRDFLDLWSDSVNFTTNFEPDAVAELRANLDVAECVLETVREAINNAVKHGGATEVQVTGSMLNSKILELRVVNNGQPLDEAAQQGYGSEVLSQCTHNWSIGNTEQGVMLKAQFAL